MKKTTFVISIVIMILLSQVNIPLTAREHTVVDVNINFIKSTNDESTFDRNKFINLHSTFWNLTPSELDYIHNTERINFGRETGELNMAGQYAAEDSLRPGYADINVLRANGESNRIDFNHDFDPFLTNEVILSSIESPFFPNGTLNHNGWAFANEHATAEFLAHYIREYYGEDAEPRPKFFEIINEPDMFLSDFSIDEVINYHLAVEDSVRKYNPDVLIGGFCSFFMDFEENDFELWNNTWKKFIDEAGDQMDFFTFHVYEYPEIFNNILRKGSNIEAIFDMMEQYSMLTLGEIKPFVISEYGACCHDSPGYAETLFQWSIIKSYSGQLLSMMDRHHLIHKAVPYIMTNGFGGPGYELFTLDGNRNLTDNIKFYQLWRDVDGTRVDSKSVDPDVQTDAYVSDSTLFLILNNLNDTETDVEINLRKLGEYVLDSVLVKHLYFNINTICLDKEQLAEEPELITIGPEGTVIIQYYFKNNIPLNEYSIQRKYYANTYLQPIVKNNEIVFNINNVHVTNKGEATLRIGLGRSIGLLLQPKLTINGTAIAVPSDFIGYDQHNRNRFFGVIEVPIPYDIIQENNQIKLTFTDATNGHVSTVCLRTAELSNEVIRTQISEFSTIKKEVLSMMIYPNPASDVINIQVNALEPNLVASMHDLRGIVVKHWDIGDLVTSSDIGDIEPGIYVISIQANNIIISNRVIVK